MPTTPRAPSLARAAVEPLLSQLDQARARDAALLVSELVTNSVRHGGLQTDERIALLVRMGTRVLRVSVSDPGRGFENRSGNRVQVSPSRQSGWGLHLVDQLAARWGVSPEDPTIVWFEMDIGDHPDQGDEGS